MSGDLGRRPDSDLSYPIRLTESREAHNPKENLRSGGEIAPVRLRPQQPLPTQRMPQEHLPGSVGDAHELQPGVRERRRPEAPLLVEAGAALSAGDLRPREPAPVQPADRRVRPRLDYVLAVQRSGQDANAYQGVVSEEPGPGALQAAWPQRPARVHGVAAEL